MGRRTASEALNEVAFAAELLGDDCPLPVDVKAAQSLAWAIRQADTSDAAALARLSGITPLLAAVIDDALHDRVPAALVTLKRALPEGLFELRQVKGLGAKKVHKLWRALHIESLGELEYACRENRLVTLDGFGAKTQQTIAEQLAALSAQRGLLRRDQALALASETLAHLNARGARTVIAGELDDGKELVSEVVIISDSAPSEQPPARVRVVVDDAFDTFVTQRAQRAPKLITRAALRGALHNHTTDSDGADDLLTMLDAAHHAGLSWLGISDHSVAAAYAHGVDAARLRAQRAAIAVLSHPCRAITGVEADILKDGSLDLDEGDALAACDVVIASMHQRFGLGRDAQTARLVRAAQHPYADVIGHPTGRLLLSRPAADFDIEQLIATCARTGTALELNANPARLDLSAEHLRLAKERGVLISIAADAHAASELANLDHGIAVARAAGLTDEDVLNTRSVDELLAWVTARRATARGDASL